MIWRNKFSNEFDWFCFNDVLGPMKVIDPENYNEFPLVDKVPVSSNASIYKFSLPRSSDKLNIPIGQHITISATIEGKEITRSYTPISSEEDEGYFELLIKTYPKGNVSRFVDNLSLYESIKVKGPKGRMQYKPNMAKNIGMIAGGTGIAPMLQVISAIVRNPEDLTNVSLIFANVSHSDILLKEDIDTLAEKYPNFKVHYVLNEAPQDKEWNGSVGFVTEDIIKAHIAGPEDNTRIFICGPPPMVSAMKKATLNLGYQKANPVSKPDDQVFVF